MTTNVLSSSEVNTFDYVIVGGGTAGCVIASRLTEYLPEKKVLLIEVVTYSERAWYSHLLTRT